MLWIVGWISYFKNYFLLPPQIVLLQQMTGHFNKNECNYFYSLCSLQAGVLHFHVRTQWVLLERRNFAVAICVYNLQKITLPGKINRMWGASVKSLNSKRHPSLSVLFLFHNPHMIFSLAILSIKPQKKK